MDDILYSRNSDEWSTPDDIFKKLDAEFKFNLDPCATKENAKCQRFFTKKNDGLKMSWGGQRVFCNPPYSEISVWVEKAYKESLKDNTVVVMLVPSRTDTSRSNNK